MRLTTLCRAAALAVIVVATAGIVTSSMPDAPMVSSDYLVQSDVVSRQISEPSSNVAKADVLTDWEYTARARPVKCRFIN